MSEILYRRLQSILYNKNGHFRFCPFWSIFTHFVDFCPFCNIENSVIKCKRQLWLASIRNFSQKFYLIEHIFQRTSRKWSHYGCCSQCRQNVLWIWCFVPQNILKNGQKWAKSIFAHFFPNFAHFYPFLTIFVRFWPFLPILHHISLQMLAVNLVYRCLQSILYNKNGHFRFYPFLPIFIRFCPFLSIFTHFVDFCPFCNIENSVIKCKWQLWLASIRNFSQNFYSIEHIFQGTSRKLSHYGCCSQCG